MKKGGLTSGAWICPSSCPPQQLTNPWITPSFWAHLEPRMTINLFNLLTIPPLSWLCICPWSTSGFRSLSALSCFCQRGLSRSRGDPRDHLFCFCLVSCLVSLLHSTSALSDFPWFAFFPVAQLQPCPLLAFWGFF